MKWKQRDMERWMMAFIPSTALSKLYESSKVSPEYTPRNNIHALIVPSAYHKLFRLPIILLQRLHQCSSCYYATAATIKNVIPNTADPNSE